MMRRLNTRHWAFGQIALQKKICANYWTTSHVKIKSMLLKKDPEKRKQWLVLYLCCAESRLLPECGFAAICAYLPLPLLSISAFVRLLCSAAWWLWTTVMHRAHRQHQLLHLRRGNVHRDVQLGAHPHFINNVMFRGREGGIKWELALQYAHYAGWNTCVGEPPLGCQWVFPHPYKLFCTFK